jgi:chromosome segregation ATPase
MMEEIGSAMTIAARVGYQVGRQWQVDRVINEWAEHANSYMVQRDEAWRQIELGNARIVALKKENAQLLEDLNRAKNQLKIANKALEVRGSELSDAKSSAAASDRRVTAALQQVNELKKSEDQRRKDYAQHLEAVQAWGSAGIARGRARAKFVSSVARAEHQILLRLTMEIKRACPSLQLPSLDAAERKKIRMKAWEDGGGPALGEKVPPDSFLLS